MYDFEKNFCQKMKKNEKNEKFFIMERCAKDSFFRKKDVLRIGTRKTSFFSKSL